MLLVATAEVDANAVSEPFALDLPPYRVEVAVDQDGFWSEVRITKRVADWRACLLQPVVSHEAPPPTANVRPLSEAHLDKSGDVADLRDLLRHVESFCGYVMGVEYVDWFCPKLEWIAESPEEEAGLTVSKWDVHYDLDPPPVQVDPTLLAKAILNRPEMSYLDVPLSFFREGRADYGQRKYINAFFNFYFFIEGLYAGGRSNEKDVVGKYLQSGQLTHSAARTLQRLESMTDPVGGRHALNLRVFLGELGFAWDPEGLLRLVVRMRNKLHHYSHRSQGVRLGHPLNQSDYESLAALAMGLCVECITPLITGSKPDGK
ncbi:MAG: hypothetical protein WC709_06775 [Thermoleophilia bacterium]